MKKLIILLVFSVLGTASGLFGQITIGLDDVPAIGDVIVYGADTLDPAVDIGMPGGNQSWDFSNVDEDMLDTTLVLNPADGPNSGDFPNANLGLVLDGIFNYAQVTPNEVLALGAVFDPAEIGTEISINFDPPQTLFQLPTNFGDSYTTDYTVDIRFDGSTFGVDSVWVRQVATDEVTVDAWGTVDLPSGTYDALRREIVSTSFDTVRILLFGFWQVAVTEESTATDYEWLAKESKVSLCEVELDDLGNVESFLYFQSIENDNQGPIALFTYEDEGDGQVQFTDLSANDPDTWSWDFDDGGTSTDQNPSHTFAESGTYNVCLTVTNAQGSNTFCSNVNILLAPEAAFTAEVVGSGIVQFTDASMNVPDGWSWDFGDGSSSTEQNPLHQYTEPGDYTVCLTASNAAGSNEVCETVTAVFAPETSFSYSQTMSSIVDFTDESTNDPTAWSWDFGDGQTSSEQNPSHAFDAPGEFEVCLTASNAAGFDQFCENVIVIIISVEEVQAANSLQIIPNPATDAVLLQWQAPPVSGMEFFIYDALGREMTHQPVTGNTTLDVSSWSKGVYQLLVRSADGQLLRTVKLLVQ